MKKYDAMYFIKKFDAIPENEWTILNYVEYDSFTNSVDKCVMGHCNAHYDYDNKEATALRSLFEDNIHIFASQVNDGFVNGSYELGNNPKERILNALYLINAIQELGL
jgi:hypothetical protein